MPPKHRINPKCHTVYPVGISLRRMLIKVKEMAADSIKSGPAIWDFLLITLFFPD